MNKHPIFVGIDSMTESAARDLVVYLKVANDATGIITSKGHLITDQYVWDRPCAEDNFEVLKEALKGNEVSWITVSQERIALDFSKLQYNVEWLKGVIATCGFGVKDSKQGLVIFTPVKSNGQIWYTEQFWPLRGVAAKDVGAREFRLVALSPSQYNPDTAKWGKLHFA